MRLKLQHILQWSVDLFRRIKQQSYWGVPDPPAPDPLREVMTRRKPRRIGKLRADVLDQLDRYQVYIKRLKKQDADAYKMYRRIGAYLMSPDIEAAHAELEPGFLDLLPSFGAIAIGLSQDCDADETADDPKVPVRFAYFMKVERPGFSIEQSNGTIYRVTCYYDDVKDQKIKDWGAGVSFDLAISIAADGSMRALRMLRSQAQVIRHRHGIGKARKGANTSVIHHQRWGLPMTGEEERDEYWNKERVGRAVVLCKLFTLMVNYWLTAARSSMIRITATKGSVVMPFVVDILDTPAFFADRETVTTKSGTKARIFHIVRAHARDGKGIKTHFRGLRQFQWNGYQINITVPGRDQLDYGEFKAGALLDIDDPIPPDHIDMHEMADRIADLMEAPNP